MMDRSGFVGADGPTHAGSFDIAYLINLPDFVLMAPSSGQELLKMMNTASTINYCPSAIRYPRGEASSEIDFNDSEILEIGKSKIVQKGRKVAIVAYGAILQNVIKTWKVK
jgi:1-deoxy-D-xylulose-5-phosphate synthase